MKILIIEDETDLLIGISNFLTKQNYICELADTFRLAEDKLLVNEYDIILLDIGLPDGNGLDLLKIIKFSTQHLRFSVLYCCNGCEQDN